MTAAEMERERWIDFGFSEGAKEERGAMARKLDSLQDNAEMYGGVYRIPLMRPPDLPRFAQAASPQAILTVDLTPLQISAIRQMLCGPRP